MSDKSPYTYEFGILATCWYHESDKSIASMRALKAKLCEKFNVGPPHSRVISTWEEKLFSVWMPTNVQYRR